MLANTFLFVPRLRQRMQQGSKDLEERTLAREGAQDGHSRFLGRVFR